MAGFTLEEMKTLKEEFSHHQEKVDLYYNMLESLGDEGKKDHHESNKKKINLNNISILLIISFSRCC